MRQCLVHRAASLGTSTTLYAGECVLNLLKQDKVARLTMRRHVMCNALGRQMVHDLRKAVEQCNAVRTSVRCLLLDSAVPHVFCSGADLKERMSMTASETLAFVQELRETLDALAALAVPTIAVVEGAALGGGLELALATDLRVAGSEARLGFPETRLGVLPGAGGTVRATALVGASHALELMMLAEPVSAARAEAMGLVSRVVPAGQANAMALQLAARIATNGPLAVQAVKRSVRQSFGQPQSVALAQELKEYSVLLQSADRREGLQAFLEKRPANFSGN